MSARLRFCLLLLAFASAAGSAWLKQYNEEPPAPAIEVLATHDCSAEKLSHAIDEFRLQPNNTNRSVVKTELAALDVRIQALEDKAELVEGKGKAQLLVDAKALRTARKFNLARFNAPIEKQPSIAVVKAEKADSEIPKAIAVVPAQTADVKEVEVRRAIPVAHTAATSDMNVADNIPIRRAIAVETSIATSRSNIRTPVIVKAPDNRRITIWQATQDYHPELARR